MQRSEIHRRALRGAAAVAFTLGLAGCGGKSDDTTPAPTPPDPKADTGTVLGDAASQPTPDAAPEVVAETAADTGADETKADTATKSDVVAETDGPGCVNPAADPSSAWDCCQLPDGTTDLECCKAHGWYPVDHCTPWGPPVPPAFVLAEREEGPSWLELA